MKTKGGDGDRGAWADDGVEERLVEEVRRSHHYVGARVTGQSGERYGSDKR